MDEMQALEAGCIEMAASDKPKSSKQRYKKIKQSYKFRRNDE
ncbi:Fic family protein [Clostridium aminobutyricum]|nr:hypothetical protein [Clostridium aminobutyricum]